MKGIATIRNANFLEWIRFYAPLRDEMKGIATKNDIYVDLRRDPNAPLRDEMKGIATIHSLLAGSISLDHAPLRDEMKGIATSFFNGLLCRR